MSEKYTNGGGTNVGGQSAEGENSTGWNADVENSTEWDALADNGAERLDAEAKAERIRQNREKYEKDLVATNKYFKTLRGIRDDLEKECPTKDNPLWTRDAFERVNKKIMDSWDFAVKKLEYDLYKEQAPLIVKTDLVEEWKEWLERRFVGGMVDPFYDAHVGPEAEKLEMLARGDEIGDVFKSFVNDWRSRFDRPWADLPRVIHYSDRGEELQTYVNQEISRLNVDDFAKEYNIDPEAAPYVWKRLQDDAAVASGDTVPPQF